MPTPKDAADALRRAVDAQVAQRDAAQRSRKVVAPQGETDIERPDTDVER